MKYWVAYRNCPDCVESVMPDSGSILPPGAENEFIRQSVALGLKTRLSETEVSVGRCSRHREIAPVDCEPLAILIETVRPLSLPSQAEESNQEEQLPDEIRETIEFKLGDPGIEICRVLPDGQVVIAQGSFPNKAYAADKLRQLADKLDGGQKRK